MEWLSSNWVVITLLFAVLLLFDLWLLMLLCQALGERNILFTVVREGTAKAITRAGKYQKTILRYRGHEIDDKGNVVKAQTEKLSWYRRFVGGLYFIGIPFYDRVHTYTLTFPEEGPGGEIVMKPQTLDFVWVQVKEFDFPRQRFWTKDDIRVLVDYAVFLRIINPSKAYFAIANYMEAVIDLIQAYVRGKMVSYKSIEKLIEADPATILDIEEFKGEREGRLQALHDDYGIEIVNARVIDVEAPEDVEKAMRQKYVAKKEAEGVREKAGGERDREVELWRGRKTGFKEFAEAVSGVPEDKGPEILKADATHRGGGLVMNFIEQVLAALGKGGKS